MVSVRADIDSHFVHDLHGTFVLSKTFVGVGEDREAAINDALVQAAERCPNASYRTFSDVFDIVGAPPPVVALANASRVAA